MSDSPIQLHKCLNLKLYPNNVLKFFTKYTKRRPFEQTVFGLLQELHDLYKCIPRAQFRVSIFNFKKNVHTGHTKNGYNVNVRMSGFSFVVVAFYLKIFFIISIQITFCFSFQSKKMYLNFHMGETKGGFRDLVGSLRERDY
jgi:hypothetical protein